MGMLEEVGTYLAAQGCGTIGFGAGASTANNTRIAYRTLVESTSVVVALYEAPGGSGGVRTYGSSLPVIEQARMNVLVRSTAPAAGATVPDTSNAKAASRRVWAKLEAVVNTTLSGTAYQRIASVVTPYPTDRDEQGRIVFQAVYEVWRTPSSTGG